MGETVQDVIIRRARVHEANEVWQVTRRAFEPYRGRIRPEFGALSVSVSTIEREILSRRRVYGVAIHNGRIAATLRYRRWRAHLGLSRLAVLPECQSLGLGTRLMLWAEDEARRLGIRELRGEVRTALPELVKYYERLGWRPFERRSGRGYRGYLIAMRKWVG